MGDEFHLGSGNWYGETSSRNRFDNGTLTAPTSISTTLNAIASYGWPTEMVEVKSAGGSNMVLQGGGGGGSGRNFSANSNLQMMGLGLSSQAMDWKQALIIGKSERSSHRSMLQGDLSSNSSNFHQESSSGVEAPSSEEHWRQKLYSDDSTASLNNNFKQMINRGGGFSLDHQYSTDQFSSQAGSNDSTITSSQQNSNFQEDSAAYGSLLLSESPQQYSSMNNNNNYTTYQYSSGGYGANSASHELILMPPSAWNNNSKFSHLSNNTTSTPTTNAFWNSNYASTTPIAPLMNDSRAPSFDEKPKKTLEARNLVTTTKKNNTEMSSKRPRHETPSTLPAFKVRKEKMGDRITALQQLVSPFGKTDTASVLSETYQYIKFLNEQINMLSTPYMKNGAPIHHQMNSNKSKDRDGPRQDLRSRGLCLVPISSTFPLTHETTVDFWTPTFGGSFR